MGVPTQSFRAHLPPVPRLQRPDCFPFLCCLDDVDRAPQGILPGAKREQGPSLLAFNCLCFLDRIKNMQLLSHLAPSEIQGG